MLRSKQIKLQIISKPSSSNSSLTNRSTCSPSKEQSRILLESYEDFESSPELEKQMQPNQIAEHLSVLKHFELFQLQQYIPEYQGQSCNTERERRLSTINQEDYVEQHTDLKRTPRHINTSSVNKQHNMSGIPGINIFSTISRNTEQGQSEDCPLLNTWSNCRDYDKNYQQASTFMSETKLNKQQSQAILSENLVINIQQAIDLNKYIFNSQQNTFKKFGVQTMSAQIEYTCSQQQLQKIYKILQCQGVQIKQKNVVKSKIVRAQNLTRSKISNRGIKLFIKQKIN